MKKLLFLLFLLIPTLCFASFISNADIDDEDMADITDWTDNDTGTGESSQVTFDSKSCMKLDSGGTTGVGNIAIRQQDIGSFGSRTVFSLNLYCDAIGTFSDFDWSQMIFCNGIIGGNVVFSSDGLFVNDGSSWNEVGTNLVVQDTWQEWTFDVDWTAQTVDIYLNQILKASGVDIFGNSEVANGTVSLSTRGNSTANRISYIDWFKAGSDFTPPPVPVLINGGTAGVKINGNVEISGSKDGISMQGGTSGIVIQGGQDGIVIGQ